MEKSKRTKFFYHDTRNQVGNSKEYHIRKLNKPLKEQKESPPPKTSEGNLDPMDVDSAKHESSHPTS